MGLKCFFSTQNRFLFTRVVVAVQSCNESIFMVDSEQAFIQKVNPIITFILEELVLVSRSDVVGTWEDGKKINANVNACFDWLKRDETIKKSFKNFMAPFYGWGSTASRLQPLWEGSLLFTIQFPDIPGTHFNDLGRMKGWVNLGATQRFFWTQDPWIGNPAP